MPAVAASVILQVGTHIFPVSVIYNKCRGCLEPSLCIAKCVVHSSLGRDGTVEPGSQPIQVSGWGWHCEICRVMPEKAFPLLFTLPLSQPPPQTELLWSEVQLEMGNKVKAVFPASWTPPATKREEQSLDLCSTSEEEDLFVLDAQQDLPKP